MRSAWIYQNSDPDLGQIAKYGVELIYLDPRSSNAAAVIQKLHAAGVGYGVYYDPSWDGWQGPLATAKLGSAHLTRLGLNGNEPVMFDLETTDVGWVRRFIAAWRVLRPLRSTQYTQQPFQGGYVPTLALRLARIDVYLQTYYGDMSDADGAAVTLEQTRRGLPPSMCHPFYSGKSLPHDARDGCIFTLELLP